MTFMFYLRAFARHWMGRKDCEERAERLQGAGRRGSATCPIGESLKGSPAPPRTAPLTLRMISQS